MPAGGDPVRGVPYFLPTAYIPLAFSGGRPPKNDKDAAVPTYQATFTPGATTYVADQSAPYFLAYNHSAFADDRFSPRWTKADCCKPPPLWPTTAVRPWRGRW